MPGLTACPGGPAAQRTRAALLPTPRPRARATPNHPVELRLLRAPQVVLSSHVAGVIGEILIRIALAAVQNVIGPLDGRPLRDDVS